MTRVVVTGYASLDHVVALAGPVRPGATTRMQRSPGAWPRLGGGPFFVAAALAAGGVAKPAPVSWVGEDAAGRTYRAALAARGLPIGGVVALAGATPAALLAYAPDGDCICLYDPGLREPPNLTSVQQELVAAADWVCLTIGPPGVTDAVLDLIAPTARLAWVVKDDRAAAGPAQAARIAARADLICHNAAEAGFVADAGGLRTGVARIETHGRRGATIFWRGQSVTAPATPVGVSDPTGAGDTLVGGAIAALIAHPDDPPGALRAGIAAAAAMLRQRSTEERS